MGTTKKTYDKFCLGSDVLAYNFTYNKEETSALHSKLNYSSEIDINDLRRVSLWKLNRSLGMDDDVINKLRKLAKLENLSIDDSLVKEVIGDLVKSRGIGFPMASSILKFIRPDVFPIIDVRAYRALTGKKISYGTYSYNKYVCYVKELNEIAEKLKRPLREIDEQLYCYDKEKNGKI